MNKIIDTGNSNEQQLFIAIKDVLLQARNKAYVAVNSAMVEAYWTVGKLIVMQQGGEDKAEYGTHLLEYLSDNLTKELGKGFTVTNLKYMRMFYLTFPNRHALRDELTWTHYRLLLKVENREAREFYMDEAVKAQWSTRQLERQINTFYYNRLLSSQDKSTMNER